MLRTALDVPGSCSRLVALGRKMPFSVTDRVSGTWWVWRRDPKNEGELATPLSLRSAAKPAKGLGKYADDRRQQLRERSEQEERASAPATDDRRQQLHGRGHRQPSSPVLQSLSCRSRVRADNLLLLRSLACAPTTSFSCARVARSRACQQPSSLALASLLLIRVRADNVFLLHSWSLARMRADNLVLLQLISLALAPLRSLVLASLACSRFAHPPNLHPRLRARNGPAQRLPAQRPV
jgi:hypothetical protein